MSSDHPGPEVGRAQEHGADVRVLAAVIRANGRYLLCRRPRHKRHGGYWEFPGGKLEAGETLLAAAQRELKEELGIEVTGVSEPLLSRRDEGSQFVIEFVAVDVQGTPHPLEHEELRWVEPKEGKALQLAPADAVFWQVWVCRETGSGVEEGQGVRAPTNRDRLVAAFSYAAELHASQYRKGGSIPYVSHLMAVTAIVMEHDGDEDQAIAALLHDAIEDHPDNGRTRNEIRERFGDRVLALVDACSDADTDHKPPWRERKERYLAHLREAPPDAWLVSLADKLHNARAILADHRRIGDRVWQRFKATKEETLWYYRGLADKFLRLKPGPLAQELDVVVTELERRAG